MIKRIKRRGASEAMMLRVLAGGEALETVTLTSASVAASRSATPKSVGYEDCWWGRSESVGMMVTSLVKSLSTNSSMVSLASSASICDTMVGSGTGSILGAVREPSTDVAVSKSTIAMRVFIKSEVDFNLVKRRFSVSVTRRTFSIPFGGRVSRLDFIKLGCGGEY